MCGKSIVAMDLAVAAGDPCLCHFAPAWSRLCAASHRAS